MAEPEPNHELREAYGRYASLSVSPRSCAAISNEHWREIPEGSIFAVSPEIAS
jgi:hypothetical protein